MGFALRMSSGFLDHLSSSFWMSCRFRLSWKRMSCAVLTHVWQSEMKESIEWDFQLRSLTPAVSVLSIFVMCVASSGTSTGSISRTMRLYMLTMRSRLPVCRRYVSAFL